MFRSALASLVVASGLFLVPVGAPGPASAQVSVDINIGIGTLLSGGRRISCSQGERILRNRGFRDIRRVDCRGRNFVYRGTRRGNRYEIAVRSSNGRVADYRRVGRR
jgi:hypothetical protein